MKKKITVKADSTYKYLQLWNGIQKVGSTYVLNRLLIPELNGETIEITILKK